MTNKVDVLLGLQWGDEGKGKVVDVLTLGYDLVARFQGGPNAGHTLEFDGHKYVLRSIPSGVFQGEKKVLIGNGVVLDPILFRKESEELASSGIGLKSRLMISKKAHLILPTHRLLDAANEASKGSAKIGTTGKGIGPTYTDKISRNGLRVGDLLSPSFEQKLAAARERHGRMLVSLTGVDGTDSSEYRALEEEWLSAAAYLREFVLVDGEYYINELLHQGGKVLAEGAQGTLLDVDFGSYPFVTSSNTITAGCCTGLGIAPSRVGRVYGIFKAYCTRVGAGPFPTELFDATGEELCQRGHEYGAVTGRKRRCGWLDLPALRYTVMLNGVTDLIMMKSDVMDSFEEIKVAVAYKVNDERTERFPFDIEHGVEPEYKSFEGWMQDMTSVTEESQFPEPFKAYISFIESYLGVPISIVSVGPDRMQTIFRSSYTEGQQ